MITLWGARQSGKTVFLIALYHEILHSKKGWLIAPGDERSAIFIEQAHREFVMAHKFPQPSMGDAPKDRIYTFDIQIPGHLGMKAKDVQFDFLDPGGEIFEKPELDAAYDNIVFDTIKESMGLIFLLDSAQKEQHKFFSLFIRNFQKLKNTFTAGRGFQKVPIPVIICVTKMDKDDNFVNNPEKFDIETYVKELVGDSAYRMLITHLKTFKMFGVSSLGWDKNGKRNYFLNEDGDMCPSGKLVPVNVIEAVEWLLKNGLKK